MIVNGGTIKRGTVSSRAKAAAQRATSTPTSNAPSSAPASAPLSRGGRSNRSRTSGSRSVAASTASRATTPTTQPSGGIQAGAVAKAASPRVNAPKLPMSAPRETPTAATMGFVQSHGGFGASSPVSNIQSDRPSPGAGTLDYVARNADWMSSPNNINTSPSVQNSLQGSQVAPIYSSARAANRDYPAHSGTLVQTGFIKRLPPTDRETPGFDTPDTDTSNLAPWNPLDGSDATAPPTAVPTQTSKGTTPVRTVPDALPIYESGGGRQSNVSGSMYEHRSSEVLNPGGITGMGDTMSHEKLITTDNATVTNKFKVNLPQVINTPEDVK